ncbi:hypothetical protein AB0L35_36505 [Streptomyces sp. NPDC052309]|uniref:hypothetical protein n=1 Tax=Streptomyces sp. NPDC052309 TaxID=3155421 RepID=UPI0034408D18
MSVGLFLQRMLFWDVLEWWCWGEVRGHVGVPGRYRVFLAVCLAGVSFAGFVLTR